MIKENGIQKKAKSTKGFHNFYRNKEIRIAHAKLRLCSWGNIYFGWLRPDEIIEFHHAGTPMDYCVLKTAFEDKKKGICTLRPMYWEYAPYQVLLNLFDVSATDHIPTEVLNYDNIKNWWHGFSSPGAHLWRKDVW